MSIYSGSRRGWKDLNDVVQTLPHRTQPSAANASTPLQDSNDWTAVRKARPAEYLLPLTEKWFDGFPPDRAPCALASQYPRVCNMIAVQWNGKLSSSSEVTTPRPAASSNDVTVPVNARSSRAAVR